MRYKCKIKGLDCANCAGELERALSKIEGIESVVINFMTEKMIIECEENEKEKIMKNIRKVAKKEEPDVTIEEI